MKNRILVGLLGLLALCSGSMAAPLGTAITYQGRLADGVNPASGSYDLKFTLYADTSGGSAVAGPLTNSAVAISNGLFTVTLDFGTAYDGNARWLQIGVRSNGAAVDFTTLSPRQSLTASPYALYAPSAGAATTATTAATASSVAAANITGTIALSQLPGVVVTNNASGVTLGGTFIGSGIGLSSVNADQVDGQHGAFYQNATNLTSGTLADARLSANVALLNTNQVFSGSNRFSGVAVMTNAANSLAGTFAGNASGLTNLNASQLASGTVPDGRLSSNVAFLNGNQSFTGSNRFAGVVTLTNVANTIVGAFNGNATALTNLNASQLTSGTVPLALLPGAVVTNNETGLNLSGTFSGNGAGVTNVNLVTANNQGAIGWTTNWGNFVLASSPNVGATPYSVAAADVNNDGKLDLISANSYPPDSSVSVLTNNGGGGFVTSATISVGRGPVWVTAADVGGNNKVDLVTANSETNTVTVLTNNGSGQFVLAATLTVGANPYAVVAADVNSDGKLDLVSANQGDSSLSLLTNGNSGFLPSATLPVGPGPRAVAVADVNADGKVDLISANTGFNTLTVLTNNGSGGFVLASSPPAGIFPIAVAAADLNGDGKTDLVAANSAADTLTVLTNNGSGGFVAAPTLTVGAQPYYVAATDVTGDGKADLVSANFGANTLTLLTNNGTGGFVTAATLTVGNNPHSVAAADVSGDGKVDLISANAGPSTLSILFNGPTSYGANFTGNGASLNNLNAANLTGTAGSLSATNVNVLGVITGNGSGLTNLNASQLISGTVSLALLPAAVVTNNETGLNLSGNFSGNFSGNGAGLTNLSATNLTGTIADARLSTSVALLNTNQAFTGSNRFSGVVTLTNAANTFAGVFAGSGVGTFAGNGSGLTNLNASQFTGGTLPPAQLPAAVVTNNATNITLTGVFSGSGAGLTNVSATNLTGTIADARLSTNIALLNANQVFAGSNRFAGVVAITNAANAFAGAFTGNGAGLTNLSTTGLTGTIADGQLSANVVLLNTSQAFTGSNRFAGAVTLTNAANNVAGTFTGNGGAVTNVNLLTANGQGAIRWATNWGTLFVWASSSAVGPYPFDVTAADVNGDSKVDLISANQGRGNGNTLSVLTNNGSGAFVLASSPVVGNSPTAVVAADVNADGKPDLISVNSTVATLSVLTNNGSGGFVLASSPAVGAGPYSAVVADVNSDGKPDLISVNYTNNTLSVLTNNGSGGFVLSSSPGVGAQPMAIAAADVNADGKGDLISANFGANTLTVLTNNGSGGFVLASSPGAGAAPRSIAAADVNGDGKQDLIVANQNASALTVLTNSGSGSFVTAYSLAVGSIPVCVRTADVNGDSKPDLMTANLGGNTLSVLINNGSGGFLPAYSVGVGTGPAAVAAADVNSDGRLDLISANNDAASLTIVTNAPAFAATFQGAFVGNGAGLTNLNATHLTGTVADARLSANVALLNANQAFTGSNRFASVVVATNAANTLAGTFIGNGAALTNLVFPTAANYVFSYSTTTQAVVTAGTFQDITNNTDAQISGWTHAANTASFTSAQSGLYLIQYNAEVTTTTTASSSVSLRAVLNGAEIAGSQATANANTANLVVSVSKSFVASVSSGGILKFQLTGSSVNDRLISNTGTGTTRPSFSCTIMRLQ